MNIEEKLKELHNKAKELFDNAVDQKQVEEARLYFLGKKGEFAKIMEELRAASPEEKKILGKSINEVKQFVEAKVLETREKVNKKINEIRLVDEKIDVSLPATKIEYGHLHPCTKIYLELEDIFKRLGYTVIEGPEIEYDEYNFEKLNIEKGHPARDENDTFYITDKILLRTQTSPVQARVMEQGKLPICMISPGKVYRSDSVDATHSPTFNQIEGLVVDKNITFADLKGTLTLFAKELFGPEIKTRFRPHHFPFTEPSAEMDVSCFKCGGKGCSFCKGEGWIEILGCGIVNPRVFDLCGIDKNIYSGFAFGIGMERIALLKYEIDDMRLLYENDIRFLRQF